MRRRAQVLISQEVLSDCMSNSDEITFELHNLVVLGKGTSLLGRQSLLFK